MFINSFDAKSTVEVMRVSDGGSSPEFNIEIEDNLVWFGEHSIQMGD